MMFNCDEARHTCDKAQYNEANLWDSIKLNMHIIFCRLCRKHSARNGKLTKAVKNSQIQTLSPEQKNVIKEQLRQKMS
ncbi:hypothetical protein DZ858_01060 [Marixanthomonas ophiurae]|uniref:Glycine dehydrogenase n=1 Tax=Marixanthomonas ophiurae TaxID=387659 RepID=A0A3E1QE29_9FLAO|nr:hypothetical protein DZ858_01060 [Marixanthomonas ophiurae]